MLRRKISSSSPSTRISTRAMCAFGGFSAGGSSKRCRPWCGRTPAAVIDGQAIEAREVVDPAHGHDVASGLARPAPPDERDVGRAPNGPIGGAVDEAGDVAAAAVG